MTGRKTALITTVAIGLLATSTVNVAAQGPEEAATIGAFEPTGSLAAARTGHTATLLSDGRVLMIGGHTGEEDLATAELFDPAIGAFDPAGSLGEAQTGYTASLLPDGRVLVRGGRNAEGAIARTEVWDATTSAFEPSPGGLYGSPAEPPLHFDVGRLDHSTTLLHDGHYLIVGGSGPGAAIAERYDPVTKTTEPAGTSSSTRTGHTATRLLDGSVLIVGGTVGEGVTATAERWVPAAVFVQCMGKRATHISSPGAKLVGTPGNDVIIGSVGDDTIRGLGGNDRICAGGGDDLVEGGAGHDRIDGGNGDDTLNGGKGKDICRGGKGTDWLPSCNEKKATRGTVTVKKNTKLRGPHKGRFTIARDGVTLDCDGHTISGAGRKVEGINAITLLRRKGVTVRNCDLRDHQVGIWVERSNRNTFSSNRMSHVQSGFWVHHRSNNNKLVANRVIDSLGAAYALGFRSDKNRLRDNVARKAKGSGFGVWSSRGNIITDNVARDGKLEGFLASPDGFGKPSIGNTFSGNQSIDNAEWGFRDTTTGFRGDAGTDNHYDGNTCSGNASGDSSPATLCE